MFRSSKSLRIAVLSAAATALLAALPTCAVAETVGLRLSSRGDVVLTDGAAPASLRFSLSSYDSTLFDAGSQPTTPLMLNLPQGGSTNRNSAFSADWFPFSSGLRTTAGLVWGDTRRNGNVFDAGMDNGVRSRGFLGLGWTSAASSSSSGVRWRLDADVGASFSSLRDCVTPGNCMGLGGAGLKPDSGGDGIRWNPFISIGASILY